MDVLLVRKMDQLWWKRCSRCDQLHLICYCLVRFSKAHKLVVHWWPLAATVSEWPIVGQCSFVIGKSERARGLQIEGQNMGSWSAIYFSKSNRSSSATQSICLFGPDSRDPRSNNQLYGVKEKKLEIRDSNDHSDNRSHGTSHLVSNKKIVPNWSSYI